MEKSLSIVRSDPDLDLDLDSFIDLGGDYLISRVGKL